MKKYQNYLKLLAFSICLTGLFFQFAHSQIGNLTESDPIYWAEGDDDCCGGTWVCAIADPGSGGGGCKGGGHACPPPFGDPIQKNDETRALKNARIMN